MKHYEFEINEFLDNQLDSEKQNEFFAHLSQCSECRILFNDYLEIKNETKNFYGKLNFEQNNQKKFIVPVVKKNNKYKYSFYFSAAAAIILGFLFLLNINNKDKVELKYSALQAKFISLEKNYNSSLKKKIEKTKQTALKNKTTPVEKSKNKNSLQKKVVNKIENVKQSEYASLQKGKSASTYLEYINSLPTKKITASDFLTPQIIGN